METVLTSERIKQRRKELGLSYQELAAVTGISKSTLQRYETGSIKNIPLDKLDVLAEGLQTTALFILGKIQLVAYRAVTGVPADLCAISGVIELQLAGKILFGTRFNLTCRLRTDRHCADR